MLHQPDFPDTARPKWAHFVSLYQSLNIDASHTFLNVLTALNAYLKTFVSGMTQTLPPLLLIQHSAAFASADA